MENNKNIFPDLKNEALVEAMRAVNKEENQQTQSKLIEEAIKGSFFTPVDILDENGNVLQGDGKVKIPDNSKVNFKLIRNSKNESYFALFTDINEFQKWNKSERVNTIVVVFPQIAQLVFKTKDVAGFVINPMTENIIFSRDALKNILEVMEAKMKEMQEAQQNAAEANTKKLELKFGKPNNVPDSVIDSVAKSMKKYPEIKEAYFCMMLAEGREHYVFALDIDAEAEKCEKIANSITSTAKLFLSKFQILTVPVNSPYGEGAKKVTEPFYKKEA